MDKGINIEEIREILNDELSIDHRPNWGAAYIGGIDECAERLINFISSNFPVKKSVCRFHSCNAEAIEGGWCKEHDPLMVR